MEVRSWKLGVEEIPNLLSPIFQLQSSIFYSASTGADLPNNFFIRSLRYRVVTRNSPPKTPSATLIGSGTAVMISRLQLITLLWPPPPDTSAKNSVQSPFCVRP